MNTFYAILFILSRRKEFYPYKDKFLDYLTKLKIRNYESLLSFGSQMDFSSSAFAFDATDLLDRIKERAQNSSKLQSSKLNSSKLNAWTLNSWTQLIEQITSSALYRTLTTSVYSGSFLSYAEEDYPVEFLQMDDPPLIFHFLGEKIWKKKKLTVVGSREPSRKSMDWMNSVLASYIRDNDIVTVSGGAIGIDQMAHRLSVRFQKPTIAILPSGLNQIYPESFFRLIPEVLKCGGVIISEFYPHEVVKKYHFKHRNRLIAALNQYCLLVEAREKSGSLITGNLALEYNKELLVVPGHPLDPQFRGSLELLKLGGRIISQQQDFDFL